MWKSVMRLLPLSLAKYAKPPRPGGCFTNVTRAPQNILAKIHNTRNHIYGENFNLKICMCAQSKPLGPHTKFQIEILITSTICAIHKFRENFLESSLNISETTPWMSESNPQLYKWHQITPKCNKYHCSNRSNSTIFTSWIMCFCWSFCMGVMIWFIWCEISKPQYDSFSYIMISSCTILNNILSDVLVRSVTEDQSMHLELWLDTSLICWAMRGWTSWLSLILWISRRGYVTWGRFYWYWWTVIPAWISNYIYSKT